MTIRKRLILSYIAMLMVPLALIVMVSGTLRLFLDFPAERDGASSPFRMDLASGMMGSGRPDADQIRTLSRTIAADPRFFKNPPAFADLAEGLAWAGFLAVTQNGILQALTPAIDGGWADETIADIETAIRESSVADSAPRTAAGAIRRGLLMHRRTGLAFSWVFAVPGENEATIHFIIDLHAFRKTWFLPAFLYLSMSMLILFLTNGILTLLMARSITGPLKRLETMALRIKDGNLSPLPTMDSKRESRKGKDDEFVQAFKAFDEMRVRLKASLEKQLAQEDNRRELIASISHDLRTPLSAIKGYAEGLRDGVATTDAKKRQYLDILLHKTTVMDKLIEDLFLFSRLEMRDFPYDMKRIDLGAFLSDCVDELAGDFPKLAIVFTRPTETFTVRIDPLRMRRVFTNIVQNAAVYVRRADARLTVSLHRTEDKAVVAFSDNGDGLPPDRRERVFERFFRGDPSRGREGAGLGLSIARLIVEAHDGSIHAEDATAGGARFVIELPLLGDER